MAIGSSLVRSKRVRPKGKLSKTGGPPLRLRTGGPGVNVGGSAVGGGGEREGATRE